MAGLQEGDLSRRAAIAGALGMGVGAAVGPSGSPDVCEPRIIIENPEARKREEAYRDFLDQVVRFTKAAELSPVPLPENTDNMPNNRFIHFENEDGRPGEKTRALYLPQYSQPNPTEMHPTVKMEGIQIRSDDGQRPWYVAVSAFVDRQGELETRFVSDPSSHINFQNARGYEALGRESMIRRAGLFARPSGFRDPSGWEDFPIEYSPSVAGKRIPFGVTKAIEFQGHRVNAYMLETGQAIVTAFPLPTQRVPPPARRV